MFIRWDSYLSRFTELLFRTNPLKIIAVYTAIFGLLVFTLFSLMCVYKVGRYLTILAVSITLSINYIYLDVMKQFFTHKDINIITDNTNLITTAISSFFSLSRLIIVLIIFIVTYFSVSYLSKKVGIKSAPKKYKFILSLLPIVICIFAHPILWNILYVKINRLPIDPFSHFTRTIGYFKLEYDM